jgi:Flp pilus assembly protein TadG
LACVQPGAAVQRFLSARVRRFLAACGGNVAVLYALALVPVTLAAGGAIDYARAVTVKAAMSEALESAALAVAQSKNLTETQMQTLAQQYFNANYHQSSDFGTPTPVSITKSGQNILVSTSCAMPTTIMHLIGMSVWTVHSSSTVTYGQTKLWVSLVLDNTGSMSQTDKTGLSKMTALKNASHSLLTMLQNAGTNPGDVQVAIIPFTNDVNIGKANTTWIDWSYWDAKLGSCNISGKTDAASCQVNGTWTSNWWGGGSCNIPGYSSQSSCQKAVGTWTPKSHSYWTGCVADRGIMGGPDTTYNFDVMSSAPVLGQTSSLFPTDLPSGCPQSLMGLSYDWTLLSNKIDAMSANGSTNQTIGLVWGWHAMTQGAPLSPPPLPDQTQRVIIILSDGLNTQDRWYGDGYNQSPDVDNRMAKVCSNAKAAGIIVYAVYVDLGGTQGNSTVLQACATDISKYYDLTTSGDIQKAFTDIGQQITNLRVSQ